MLIQLIEDNLQFLNASFFHQHTKYSEISNFLNLVRYGLADLKFYLTV